MFWLPKLHIKRTVVQRPTFERKEWLVHRLSLMLRNSIVIAWSRDVVNRFSPDRVCKPCILSVEVTLDFNHITSIQQRI